MRRFFLFALILSLPLVLVADDYVPGPPLRVDFGVQYARSMAYTPGPPLRVDFEVKYARPVAYTPGPPLRVDFGVPFARPQEYTPGPPMRVDFGVPFNPPPFIQGYDYDGTCPRKNGRLVVAGERFGVEQGNRRLVMEGGGVSLILSVRSWSATEIALTLPDDPRIVPSVSGGYSIGIQDEHGSWISNTDRRFSVCP